MRQRLSMQTISGAGNDSPAIAEHCPVAGSASRPCGKIGNNDDVEFETFCLMHSQKAHDVVFLRDDLGLGFTNRRITGTISKIMDYLIESGRTLSGKLPRDFDQLTDVGGSLRSIFLREHHHIEICLPNYVLKNLGGG